ncbi:hypothetical protein DY000_02014568 [Brassica cretica]|uniref:Uncharacterized protein n=1 Tax=Brassica cretica TaxID=69181 RepID=A0ABQ7DBG2_BRACR|nr:hypothetical protein DY000_02014568 [Brassica cretica]
MAGNMKWVRYDLREIASKARACVADHLSFRERLVSRQAEKEHVRAGAEFPSSSALAFAPGHETEVVTPRDAGTLAGSGVPDASALPAGSPTTPILVEDKERAADSMPPPPARKEIVLALRAPSVVPVAQPKGRKRKFTKGGDGESLQQGGLSIASGLHGKDFRSLNLLICGSETSRLAGELLELQGRWSETEAMLTAVKDSHSVKVLKLEVAIGELERDLGKTASSLRKEKKARKAKSSEVRRLQRQIEGDAGLASRGIREVTDALCSEFQARLAKISAFVGSLECIRNRDLALAMIEGGVAVVQSFQSETPPTLEAEEARLSGCKGDLAVVDGDSDLILANLKSECFLPTCSEGLEGKDPVLGESGGDAAPGLDERRVKREFYVWRGRRVMSCRLISFFDVKCFVRDPFERFPARYRLRGISGDVEYKHRGMVLGSRIFWISCLELLETSALDFGQDLETSSSPSREGTGSSWRRVPILFCTGHCSGSRDRGRNSGVPDASALPAGSSTTPILVEDKERAADSMPPPPARKEIVLALRAPSVVPVAQPKGRKRKFTQGGDGESSQQGGSSIASGLRGKFMSLIDGMISECGSETSHLAGELLELQGRWSETEAMLTAVKDSHSVKVSKLEVAIGELERDLGKTASSLLKEKKARKAKSSEVHRLQRQIEGDAGLASRGIREATDALRSEFQARLAKISSFLGSLECIRNRDLALATIEGRVAVVQSFQSETPPTL